MSLDIRAKLAGLSGSLAAWASRKSGKGSGGMIGGRIATRVDPRIAAKLAQGKRVVVVTGTNGKSTTTQMINAALCGLTAGPVAWNNNGDNMLDGITAALLTGSKGQYASLEVDEMHLGATSALVKPEVFVLLNLSRDQLDRVGEIAKVERHIRETVNKYPQATVVANCDDPLIASAAWDCPNVVWVAAGSAWVGDSAAFPRTGTRVRADEAGHWYVDDTFRRPTPQWSVVDGALVGPDGTSYPLELSVPGAVNKGNAAQAVAAAVALGADVEAAVRAVGTVRSVSGRYATYDVDGKKVRLYLAKNPAGFQQALTMVNTAQLADGSWPTLVLAVNGQTPDGKDLSWLWDVDFEEGFDVPDGAKVFVCGERGADLGVRTMYAGITAELVGSPLDAVLAAPTNEVEVLANYTSFRDFKAALARAGYRPVEAN